MHNRDVQNRLKHKKTPQLHPQLFRLYPRLFMYTWKLQRFHQYVDLLIYNERISTETLTDSSVSKLKRGLI